ncbi:MAG TPA: NAD(P)-dependent oxidoreductase [Stenomitos sp.]
MDSPQHLPPLAGGDGGGERVFITGISGCVGHYLFDELADDPRYHLYLLVRDVARLRFDYNRPNVTLVAGDFLDIERHAPLLAQMDHLIHVAAAWGEPVSYEVNYRLAHRMFELADPARVKRIVNFSTASILDSENRPLKAADDHGTDYIRSKYLCRVHLDEHPLRDRILTVYPTLIFGGSDRHPTSHLSSGLRDLPRWLGLARFLSLEATLHFIHARDIARIVKYALEHEVPEDHLVLGNPAMSADELIDGLCRAYGVARGFRIDLTPALGLLSKVFAGQMNSWDRFSAQYRHFRYRTVNAATFGLPGDLSTIEAIVAESMA